MIPIDIVHSTAMSLMEKAAIEIPEDYLEGIKAAAEVEDGDLSSFVLQSMLENYEAAKEDRRAMCGDTGCPRWYVKMGNDARIEGGPIALVRDGDEITIDGVKNTITVALSDDELVDRKKTWKAPPYKATSGILYKYIKNVKSASEGCVTDQ